MSILTIIISLILCIICILIIGYGSYKFYNDSKQYDPKTYYCYGDAEDKEHVIARKLSDNEFECLTSKNSKSPHECDIFTNKSVCDLSLSKISSGFIGTNIFAKYSPLYETNKHKEAIDAIMLFIKKRETNAEQEVKQEVKPEVKPEINPETKPEVNAEIKKQ